MEHLFYLAGACGTNTGVFPSLYDNLTCDASGNPQITSVSQVLVIAGNAVRIGMALAGTLAVIFIIIGAIMYVVSAGDSKRVSQAKSTLTYAIGGLVLVMSAYAIVTFVVQGF